MTRIQYPGLDAQKRAHSAFIERLVEIDLNDLDEMDDHQQEYLLDLIQFLLDWLTNHILACDQKSENTCVNIIFPNNLLFWNRKYVLFYIDSCHQIFLKIMASRFFTYYLR